MDKAKIEDERHNADDITLTTERLRLVRPESKHIAALFAMTHGDDARIVTDQLLWDGPPDLLQMEAWIIATRDLSPEDAERHWVIVDRGNTFGTPGRVLGSVGVMPGGFPGLGSLGYYLGQPYWGRGIMREALEAVIPHGFEVMGLDKLEAEVYATNTRSTRLLERVGLLHEGRRRRGALKREVWKDVILFGLFAAEFQKRASAAPGPPNSRVHNDPELRLETERLVLRLPHPDEADAVLDFFIRNREHLAPWSPPTAPEFHTRDHWRERLERSRVDYVEGRGLRTFLEWRDTSAAGPRIVGQANLSNVVRGVFQACHLGYALEGQLEGRGIMREALEALIAHAFGPLGLHRVQANYMTENVRSGGLLERLGFVIEGSARDYLYIDGAWRDHVLTSLSNPAGDPPAGL